MIIDGVKITERGWAGHFICSDMCKFRRNTLLEYGDKKWIVSTVGAMPQSETMRKIPEFCSKNGFETIGLGRYYETMAFEAKPIKNEEGVVIYYDADVKKQIGELNDEVKKISSQLQDNNYSEQYVLSKYLKFSH